MFMTMGIISFLLAGYFLIAIISPRIFMMGKLTRGKTALVALGMFISFIVCVEFDLQRMIAAGTTSANIEVKDNITQIQTDLPMQTELEMEAKIDAEARVKIDVETNRKAEEASKKTEEARRITEDKIPGTIGMDPQQFKIAFNEMSDKFNSDLKITNLSVGNGEKQNAFMYSFTDLIALSGAVNKKDGSVRDVIMIGQGDGTEQSGLDIVICFGILIGATNPTLSTTERGNVLRDLGMLDKGFDFNSADKSTIRNGIKYTITGSDRIGVMFSVGDANDK